LYLLVQASRRHLIILASFSDDLASNQIDGEESKSKSLAHKEARLLSEYKKAAAERSKLVNYLKAATGILSEPERKLLLEFAQIARRKCDRLRRAIRQQSAQDAA